MNNKKIIQTSNLFVVTFLISMLLLACGGGGGGGDRTGLFHTLSGKVTGGTTQNVIITLDNKVSYTTKADGLYNFSLLAGPYTVTPSKLGYTFSPASAPINVSAAATLPDFIAIGKLNDTGITKVQCFQQPASAVLGDCLGLDATVLNSQQDGMVGRDVSVPDPSRSDGRLGFSFTKVCNSGQLAGTGTCPTGPTDPVLGILPDNWGCTQDNVTGLMWEIKTNVATTDLRDMSITYTNNNSPAGDATDFVKAVNENATVLCGYKDWRLPTADELQSIVDYGVVPAAASPAVPAIDAIWFPNTQASRFWSASPYVADPADAWGVYFNNGDVDVSYRPGSGYVRLVRAGQ